MVQKKLAFFHMGVFRPWLHWRTKFRFIVCTYELLPIILIFILEFPTMTLWYYRFIEMRKNVINFDANNSDDIIIFWWLQQNLQKMSPQSCKFHKKLLKTEYWKILRLFVADITELAEKIYLEKLQTNFQDDSNLQTRICRQK